ncbi:xanthine dehydrogenase family protein subunit M [Moorella naiadis]|uniref:FAD binding domain-containing protein n=1 Tax=Moorella naiadis (nom. illeg.) TaxID=3093670 RepID=UPI003D9CA74F
MALLKLNDFYQPDNLQAALTILADSGGQLRPLAGGTDLVPAVRQGELRIKGFLDLSRLEELKGIKDDGREIHLGSLTTFSQLEFSPLVQNQVPLLAEAASTVGSPQIRNQGTIGGNIANASPAADTVTALVALEAKARLVSSQGTRIVPVAKLLCGVGKTSIQPSEIIQEVFFTALPPGNRSGFIKLGRRKALAIARMNMAVIITLDGDFITRARVALGAVGPNPSRNLTLEGVLAGQRPSSSLLENFVSEAEREVARMLGPRPSAPYKREAIKGIARDLLTRLFFVNGQVVA